MNTLMGFVHIRGMMNIGNANEIFVLPEGYRPDKIERVVYLGSYSGEGRTLQIRPNGSVQVKDMHSDWAFIPNISFYVGSD